MGGGTAPLCGQGVGKSGPPGPRHVFGSAGLALRLPMATAARGTFETAFAELSARWLPILNAFDEAGVDLCFEIHPGEDLHDGVTFEMFLERVKNHPRCNMLFDPSHFVLQQLNYLQFIDLYHSRIKMFHVKDAEFNSSARQGVYGGYQPWIDRAGRFRSLGEGKLISPAFSPNLRNTVLRAGL